MSTSFEKISKNNASSQGKTDANLANDSNHLGGIEAGDYATKKYVQEYHDNKESSLKEYLDNQDNVKLGEAKEYANSLVRNQDFSNFAKTSDITALDTKLNNTINENVAEQKNYTDTKVESVVNDVNSNFEDVNEAITQLNTNQTELFQSVSDGKTKIAGAITDKGVSTSANDTFQTMADNIGQITSGGLDTSDATASASQIVSGYSAYANGSKIYGTLNPTNANGYTDTPTYGVDSSGTTATASDIAYGKTAYSNGVLLTGTLLNTEVEEIYKKVDSTFNFVNLGIGKELVYNYEAQEYTGCVTIPVGVFALSKKGSNIVYETKMYDVGKENNKFMTATKSEIEASTFVGRYIETKGVTDSGVYITQSSTSGIKKYRYSFEELGLDPSNDIDGISFSAVGFNGDKRVSMICIIQKSMVHFYTYIEVDSGTIGMLEESQFPYWHWQISTASYEATAIPAGANLSPTNFGCFANDKAYSGSPYVLLFKINEDSKYVSLKATKVSKSINQALYYTNPSFFSANDKYLVTYTDNKNIDGNYGSMGFIVGITNSSSEYSTRSSNAYQMYNTYLNPTIISISADENHVLINSTIYSIVYDTENGVIRLTSLFDIDANMLGILPNTGARNPEAWFSNDNMYLYVRWREYIYRYLLNFENNTATKDNVWSFTAGMTSRGHCVFDNSGAIHLTGGDITSGLNRLFQDGGTKKLIGVKYRNNNFYISGESEVTE